MPSWLDYAGPNRTDKELGAYVTDVLRFSDGSLPTTALARNDDEAEKIRDLLKGRHGNKHVEVKTAAQVEAAHQKSVGRK